MHLEATAAPVVREFYIVVANLNDQRREVEVRGKVINFSTPDINALCGLGVVDVEEYVGLASGVITDGANLNKLYGERQENRKFPTSLREMNVEARS